MRAASSLSIFFILLACKYKQIFLNNKSFFCLYQIVQVFAYYIRMILLKPSIENKVALNLTNLTTVANPIYLFELVNNQTNDKFYFIAADTSQYTYRYNLFLVTVKANPNPLAGEVNLTTPEEYIYNIYEQQSTTNLNPALAVNLIQTGILRYEKEYTPRQAYTRGQTTRAVYKR